MLYARLTYVVRCGGDFSDAFQALAGILIGDPASPVLWNLFMSDFALRSHPDDIILSGVPVSHLEQADDLVLFSTSARGLQEKLDQLVHWCGVNFVTINVLKTQCMVFGPLPSPLPRFHVGGASLMVVPRYTYVGITFTSTKGFIFEQHLLDREVSARRMANVSLSVESYVGSLPVEAARLLYTARVDPHLTAGCEVTPDVHNPSLRRLIQVQHTYLRRILGLGNRCALLPLFTETGLYPLRYRRVSLALRYLLYVLTQRPKLAFLAIAEARGLAMRGFASWVSDLYHALRALEVPVSLNYCQLPSLAVVEQCLADVHASFLTYVERELRASRRLVLLRERVDFTATGALHHKLHVFREYLRVPTREHRRALTRLLAADHPLAVGQHWRLADGSGDVPREWRVCRFCRQPWAVEDETHTLLDCEDGRVLAAREAFLGDAVAHVPSLLHQRRELGSLDFLRALLSHRPIVELLAEYVHTIFELCAVVPPLQISTRDQFLALPVA